MEVILGIVIFITGYIANPSHVGNGLYKAESHHSSLEECQIARHGLDAVCTTEAPYIMFVNTEEE
jgi:hypothetical protein